MFVTVFLKEEEEEVLGLWVTQPNRPVVSKVWHAVSVTTDLNLLNFERHVLAAIA